MAANNAIPGLDEDIVQAVWHLYKHGLRPSIRQLQLLTSSSSSSLINYRLHWAAGGGLIGRGLLAREGDYRARTLRPGPLFGGVLVNRKTGSRQVLRVLPL